MIKTIYELEEVIDFIWELSQDKLHATYLRIRSKDEIRKILEKAIRVDKENVIASYDENGLRGVCVYQWDPENKYAQTLQFSIKDNYDEVADEFIAYLSDELPECELHIGIPASNENAKKYLEKRNIECLESLFDTRLYNLQCPIKEKHDGIEEITKSNFEEYAVFHDKHALPLEMYYNSKNLKIDMDRFHVFAYREDGEIHGGIFTKRGKIISEIFGLFIDEEYKNKGIESILINKALVKLYSEFGEVKEVCYFIEEECTDELNSALNAGFKINDNYRSYKFTL